jgi:hypothetical protein
MEAHDTLRFVEADKVETPSGPLNKFKLVSASDAPLGTLDGVILSPGERQVRYYVVASHGRLRTRRYLVPAGPAQLEAEQNTLRVDVEPEELTSLPEAKRGAFQTFSEFDAVDAVFAARRTA